MVDFCRRRPRRISLVGTDGHTYEFLLKANEDLRQDERVMQLFSLVNRLFREDYTARQLRLGIQVWGVFIFVLGFFWLTVPRSLVARRST